MENTYASLHQHPTFPDFYLCGCGHEICAPLAQFGLALHAHYRIHVILSGKGSLQAGEDRITLHAGEGFVITPSEPVFYEADAHEPWTYLWIGFDGARCDAHLAAIGLGSGRQTFCAPEGDALHDIIKDMQRHQGASLQNDFAREGLLFRFFSVLARTLAPPLSALSKEERENFYVCGAIQFVHNHYDSHITVSDMANHVSLNRSYLFTLFQRVLQISPQEFLTTLRLTRAGEQLASGTSTVAAIAQSVGYRDPLVFSKAFKQTTGRTPMQYRKEQRGQR